MLAKDIMNKRVITVEARMTLREVAQLFIDREISGAPVVDGQDLVGVISQTDLVRHEREAPAEVEVPNYYREGDAPAHLGAARVENPDFTRVKDVMTPVVITAEETAPVENLARLMLGKHIHRVPITRNGKLRGIVSSMDLLRALVTIAEKSTAKV